jgi:hypothetical protein
MPRTELYDWPLIGMPHLQGVWATYLAQFTGPEIRAILHGVRHFPLDWLRSDGSVHANQVLTDSQGREAWFARPKTLVYVKQFGPASEAVTWHEMWHGGQFHAQDDPQAQPADWEPFLFTPVELQGNIALERPEVEWEPTFIRRLIGNPADAARDNPSVAREAVAFMDEKQIVVPEAVRDAVENAPAPAPGPGPAPDTTVTDTSHDMNHDTVSRLDALELEFETRFGSLWRKVDRMEAAMRAANAILKDPLFPEGE